MKIIPTIAIFIVSVAIAQSGESAKSGVADCRSVAKTFKDAVEGKALKDVLGILSKDISSSPDCACELIKTAIATYKPTPEQVATMVDTAINAAPDRIEQIVNCGIAAAPDSKSSILSTASEYGFTPNPLDYPGVVGGHPGGPWTFVPNVPLIVIPPQVTRVDP